MAASQSNVKKLFSQSSHYFIGTALATFSHLFTFPIFTRIFSVADYGLLSLITVGVSTVLAISKLGLTTSSVRMYEECRAETGPYSLANYYSTFFFTACVAGCAISTLYATFVYFFADILFDSALSSLFMFSALIVCCKTVSVILLSFLRAEQRTKLFNAFSVILAYAGSGVSIFLVLFLIKGLWGFYTGQLIVQSCALVILFRHLCKRYRPRIKDFSVPLLRVSLTFGLPLVGLEFLNHILTYGDRLLIKLFCAPEALGIYSVGYNLSSYVSNVLLVPLSFAVTPLLMQTWTRDGKEATQQFLSSVTRYIALVFFPVLAGFIAVGNELLLLLASAKYQDAGIIIPFAVVGVGFFALSNVLNAGLIVQKRTGIILLHSFIATLINILLNLVLIPRFNIIGAAIATLVAYGFFLAAISISSYSLLPFPIRYGRTILYFVLAVIMGSCTTIITVDNLLLSLFFKIIFGVVFYGGLILIFDSEVRRISMQAISNRSLKGIITRG